MNKSKVSLIGIFLLIIISQCFAGIGILISNTTVPIAVTNVKTNLSRYTSEQVLLTVEQVNSEQEKVIKREKVESGRQMAIVSDARRGEAKVVSVFGLFSFGDRGAQKAALNGGIRTVSKVDLNTISILCGLICVETTQVYGK